MKIQHCLFLGLLIVVLSGFNGKLFAQQGASCCPLKVQSDGVDMSAICQQSCAVANYDPEMVKDQKKAKPGDLTKCPVSGIVFKVTGSHPVVSYRGQEYTACCTTCAAYLKADPESFL